LLPTNDKMIHSILQVIKNDLGAFLKNRLEEREDVVILSGLMNNADGSFAVGGENKLICSLLNIEQERINLNAPMGGNALVNPPFNLNLYVLFAAYYPPANYVRALKALSLTIAYFQGKQVFTPANTPGLPAGVEKMVVELVNVDLKDLSNFWTALGAKQLPAVLFKIRMVSITADIVMEEVTPIVGIDTQITQD
jgi:hypothetical protein